MKKQVQIEGSSEAWESGELGLDENYVEAAESIDEVAFNEALELQMISIRLQKSLIEDLKMIAKLNGLGYQPLMRQILQRFVDGEKKRLLRKLVSKAEKGEDCLNGEDELPIKRAAG